MFYKINVPERLFDFVDLRSTLLTLDNAQTSLALYSLNRNVNLLKCCTNFYCGKKAKAMRLTLFTNISH